MPVNKGTFHPILLAHPFIQIICTLTREEEKKTKKKREKKGEKRGKKEDAVPPKKQTRLLLSESPPSIFLHRSSLLANWVFQLSLSPPICFWISTPSGFPPPLVSAAVIIIVLFRIRIVQIYISVLQRLGFSAISF